jgi:hypothetical protein
MAERLLSVDLIDAIKLGSPPFQKTVIFQDVRKYVWVGKRPAAAWAVTGDGALATAFLFQCSAAATPIFLRGCFAA